MRNLYSFYWDMGRMGSVEGLLGETVSGYNPLEYIEEQEGDEDE